MPNPNTGHGHVFPRPDGRKARCGGPALCSECAADLARKQGQAQGAEATTVAETLYLARRRKNLSLRDVEAGCGLSVSTISRIENGLEPTWRSMATLAYFYAIDLNDLARRTLEAPDA